MAKQTIIVTGDKKLDRKFKRFAMTDNKGARKAVRTASRKVTKERVLVDFRIRVPKASGALGSRSGGVSKVRATKRSRSKIGHMVVIDRDKLFAEYQRRTGQLPTEDKKRGEPFFYPVVVEFDTEDKPLRKSLYENQQETKAEFRRELKKEIAIAGR